MFSNYASFMLITKCQSDIRVFERSEDNHLKIEKGERHA